MTQTAHEAVSHAAFRHETPKSLQKNKIKGILEDSSIIREGGLPRSELSSGFVIDKKWLSTEK